MQPNTVPTATKQWKNMADWLYEALCYITEKDDGSFIRINNSSALALSEADNSLSVVRYDFSEDRESGFSSAL